MIMSLLVRFLSVGFLAALLSASSVFAQRNSLEIRGDVHKPRMWSVDDVKKQFAGEIQNAKLIIGREKQEITATGIPLVSLIMAAELKTEKTPKHYDISFIVILEAHDGYRAYFTFAELISGTKDNSVMLVWEENGKPLPDNELPFRLRASGSDRSIYGITHIMLVDGIKLANSLKK
jgi:DMSO/TMAO reductase YedYZ molybdopterin-dependent catalytic subunit